ncbi:MAG: iron dependent repressor, metal binding and dimerization domain protein [Egibacteraceae bacterium]
MTPLIDTTEMYLRTVWELEEEGIVPIRARLVERLSLSAPAVSETVARLEQEGFLHVASNRRLELTEEGRRRATSVMRKHRLAERLLIDIIGMDWEEIHNEACRWEHVISDAVERRLIELLGAPATCPHGNPIPGLGGKQPSQHLVTMAEAAKVGCRATVSRISENLQVDVSAMRFLRKHGLRPGATTVLRMTDGHVIAAVADESVKVDDAVAHQIYVVPVPD